MANPNVQYNFPDLSVSEIVQQFYLVFPELSVDEQDFRAPKAERWQHIYMTVINYLFHISADQLTQHPFGLEFSQHNEIYEGANYIFTLGRAMQKVMQPCGVTDFCMKDIVAPSRKRLVKIMSGLINFCHFRNQRMEVYEAISEEEKEKKSQIEILSQENDEMLQKINHIKSKRAEQEPMIKTEEEKQAALSQELQGLQNDVMNKKKMLSDDKSLNAEKTSEVAQINERVASLKEEISKLDGMIVQNPERMKADMDKMQNDIEILKQTKEQRGARLIELQDQVEAKRAVNEESEHALKHINSITEEIAKLKACRLELSKLEDSVQEKKENLREIDTQEATHRRALTTRQEKLSKLTMQQEYKVKDLKQNIEAISSGQQQTSRVRQKEDAEADALEAQLRHLVQENDDKQAQFDRMMKERSDKFSELEEAVELYHVKIGDTWNSVREKLKKEVLVCKRD